MTRWMHPPELARPRQQDQFDPLLEGDRHGLSRELALAIWKRVCADATDSAGRRDEEKVRQQFNELAARIAARGRRLRPDPGRVTRVGVEISGDSLGAWSVDELKPHTPGRETLVAVEARRWMVQGEGPTASEPSRADEASTPVSRRTGRHDWLPDHLMSSSPGGGFLPTVNRVSTIFRSQVAPVQEGAVEDPAVAEALSRRGGGEPLPEALRGEMEAALGADLRRVRLHTDEVAGDAARAIHARAFTVGEDIFFAPGAFEPGTASGCELLAHELTHVVQAQQGRVPQAPAGHTRVSAPGEAMEQEAEQVARRVTAPSSARVETAGSRPGVSTEQEARRYPWSVPSVAVQRTSTLLRAPSPGASGGPLYDNTRWKINPPDTGQTLASMKTAIAGKISKRDIASATVVGVPLGTDEEMYLLNIIYQLGTKGNRNRVMKVQAEVAPRVDGMSQLGLVTVTIDAAGAATAELIQKGPLVEPLSYSKDAAIKKIIADCGVAGFEKGDKEWAATDSAGSTDTGDINDVAEALALIPKGDRAALKGVTFTRWSKLTDDDTGKELAGQFRGKATHVSKGATTMTVDQRAELRLADSAFKFGERFVGTTGKTLPASYQTILHEVGHAVERQAKGKAADALTAAALKQNTTFQASKTARKKWQDAHDKGQDVTPFKAAFETNAAANKAATAAAGTARTALAGTQVAATTIKALETDTTTKRTAAKTALGTANAAVTGWSPDEVRVSEAYRLSVAAVDTALDTYAKDTMPDSGSSADKADVALLALVTARDKAQQDLEKIASANPAPDVYNAVEQAQAAAIDAARTLAHSRGRTLRLQKFKDLVDNNKITPFTQYARDNWPYNPEEFYAEAYSLCQTDPTFVQQHYRPIYDFFNSGEHAK